MLRASSEIVVATSVASLAEKPSCSAITRPLRRAVTRSLSEVTWTHTTISRSVTTMLQARRNLLLVQVRKPFLQIQGSTYIFQRDAELDHGKRHLRLDAHDHGFGAAQADHVGQVTQRARCEGVEYVEGRHVDDDATRAETAHLFGER